MSHDIRGKTLQHFAIELFNGAAFQYDLIAQTLSYGQYRRWQNHLIRAAQAHGISTQSIMLDVATGTAGVARQLVQTSGCHVLGLDQSPGMLATAQKRLLGDPGTAHQITLLRGNANNLPFPDNYFDGLTFTYLLRYVDDPISTMRELLRVVRPGGFIGFIEFYLPHPPWRQLWYLHTRLVLPLSGRLISDGWYEVGKFLGPSIERFYDQWDVASLTDMLTTLGVTDIEHELLSLRGGLVMWGRKAHQR